MNNPNRGNIPDGAKSKKQTPLATKGTFIMKSVTIFLASGRRISKQTSGKTELPEPSNGNGSSTSKHQPKKGKAKTMEELSAKNHLKLVESLRKKTHFTKNELESLCKIYRTLVTNNTISMKSLPAVGSGAVIAKPHAMMEGIDRYVFRELMHSTFNIIVEEKLMERLFCAWDKSCEGLPIRLETWIIGLSSFLRGTMFEKAVYCFRVYDLNNDGYITKDEMFTLLRNCLIKQPQDEDPDEAVRDLVEIALKKFDVDKDGKISFQDYMDTVNKEHLLLEAFGQCLPTPSAAISFLSTLQG